MNRLREQITWSVAPVSINEVNLSIDVEVEQECVRAMSGLTEKFNVRALTLEVVGLMWGEGCMRGSNFWCWSCEKGKTAREDWELSTDFESCEAWNWISCLYLIYGAAVLSIFGLITWRIPILFYNILKLYVLVIHSGWIEASFYLIRCVLFTRNSGICNCATYGDSKIIISV